MYMVQVPISEANYDFTIHFYEFRNPLGLQCGQCESGGPPACCDNVNQTENCTNEDEDSGPHRPDTRFRFLLRPFEASVETAPSRGFHLFTPSNGGNSHTFNLGPGGFLALANSFTVSSTTEWTVSLDNFGFILG